MPMSFGILKRLRRLQSDDDAIVDCHPDTGSREVARSFNDRQDRDDPPWPCVVEQQSNIRSAR